MLRLYAILAEVNSVNALCEDTPLPIVVFIGPWFFAWSL